MVFTHTVEYYSAIKILHELFVRKQMGPDNTNLNQSDPEYELLHGFVFVRNTKYIQFTEQDKREMVGDREAHL